MQKSGDGSGGPKQPPKPRSTILGVRTVQGAKPGELPEPMVELLARESDLEARKLSEPPPPVAVQEGLDITEIKMRLDSKGNATEFYRVEGILGQGGFGIVYRGTHFVTSLKKGGGFVIDDPVAIKVISFNEADLQTDPSGPEEARRRLNERFETEVRLAKKLKDENIVAIENYGELEDGRPFYVMELLNGMDLAAILAERYRRGEGPLEWEKLKPVMLQVCSAIDTAHSYEEKGERKPIIHRDIKPENIFIITSKIGEWKVKVLDFGLAKLMAPSNPDATKKGEGVGGSPWYMSPEQAWGLTVDERSDIWSVGATMYELITGRPPFEFEILDKRETQTSDDYNRYRINKWAEIRERLFNEKPKPFYLVNPDIKVPEEVEEIVFKCLEKKPEHRFQTVAELKDAIASVNGVQNGNGSTNGKPSSDQVPAYEQPVIVNDPELLDLMEGVAGDDSTTEVQRVRRTPPSVALVAPVEEAQIPDLGDQGDHRTIPRPVEKTEIVRIRNTVQDPKKRPTMKDAGPRKKFSKWLVIGTLAGSLTAAGVGTAIVVGTSRSDTHVAQPQHDANPDRMPAEPIARPLQEPVAPGARDGGAEAVREAASADAVAPLTPDGGAEQGGEVTAEHQITINVGIPGVQVLVWDTPACRTEADGKCTLTLPAQTDGIGLTLRKRGYTDVHRNVVPDQDREIRITMERVPRVVGPTKVPNHTPRITSE